MVKNPTKPISPISHSAGRSDRTGNAVRNLILLSLPEEEYNVVRPHLEPTLLPRQKILHEPGERIDFAYFLNEGITSLVALSQDGRTVEVGIVGKEGMVGMPLVAGLQRGTFRSIMQMSGSGLRVRSEVFRDLLRGAARLSSALCRFALMQGMQAAQLSACNRLHEIEQRLCRWLLMCQDRVDSGWLPVTHEYLAQMLGTGRPSVSLAAGTLESAGLIENMRGSVKILNRKRLERTTCECYHVIHDFTGGFGLQ